MKIFKDNLNRFFCALVIFLNIFIGGGIASAYYILSNVGIYHDSQKIVFYCFIILFTGSLIYLIFASYKVNNEVVRKLSKTIPKYYHMSRCSKFIFKTAPFISLSFFTKKMWLKVIATIKISNFIVAGVFISHFYYKMKSEMPYDKEIESITPIDYIILTLTILFVVNVILSAIITLKICKYKVSLLAETFYILMISTVIIALIIPSFLLKNLNKERQNLIAKIELFSGYKMGIDFFKDSYSYDEDGNYLEINYKNFAPIMPLDYQTATTEEEKKQYARKDFTKNFKLTDDSIALCRKKRKLTAEDFETLNKWIAKHQKYFAAMDTIIGENKHIRLSEQWRNYDGLWETLLLPELGRIRGWTRIYYLRTSYYLNKGEINKALKLIPYQKQLLNYTNKGHVLITYLVNLACKNIILSNIEQLISSKKLTSGEINNLIDFLRRLLNNSGQQFNTAMFGEANMAIEDFRYSKQDYIYIQNKIPFKAFQSSYFYKYLLMPSRYYVEKELNLCYDLHNLQLRIEASLYYNKFKHGMTKIPDHYYLLNTLMGDFSAVKVKRTQSDQQIKATIGALFIELFRQKYNRLPKSFIEMGKNYDNFPYFNDYWHYRIGKIKFITKNRKISERQGYIIYNSDSFYEKDNDGLFGRVIDKNGNKKYYDDVNCAIFTD